MRSVSVCLLDSIARRVLFTLLVVFDNEDPAQNAFQMFYGSGAWFAHQLLPSMLQRRCGAVVFLSSMMGDLGNCN